MRNSIKKTALAALIVASGINSAAAESVQVKVVGTIVPAACTPSLSGGGIFNYGNIRASTLSNDKYTMLPILGQDFAIKCDAPAKIALRAINDRPGSLAGATEAANGNGFPELAILTGGVRSFAASGLGLDGTNRIGGYAMAIDSGIMADGNSVASIHSNTQNGTGAWVTAPSYGYPIHTGPRLISWAENGTDTPLAFKELTGRLRVQAYLNLASELDLSHAIHLDGQTTLEVVYL